MKVIIEILYSILKRFFIYTKVAECRRSDKYMVFIFELHSFRDIFLWILKHTYNTMCEIVRIISELLLRALLKDTRLCVRVSPICRLVLHDLSLRVKLLSIIKCLFFTNLFFNFEIIFIEIQKIWNMLFKKYLCGLLAQTAVSLLRKTQP